MAITMIDPVEVAAKEFPESHLFAKLQRKLGWTPQYRICLRKWSDRY